MSAKDIAAKALEQGKGILRLAPNWVPRSFCVPGRRIKLHPDDYYALGGERGGIDERWFASTTPADNGPLTSKDEGLSFIVFDDNGKIEKVRLIDAVAELKGQIIGDRLWDEHQRWPMYSKFFDNKGALPHHLHHRDEHAALTGQLGKPEAYYFPPQANNHGGDFPYTFFGLNPGVTKDQVRKALKDAAEGRDNKITSLAPAHRLVVGTGWDVPPGVLHAPGSLCTYEPQKASDVFAMYENITHDQVVPKELLWKDTPEDKMGDVDWLLDVIDWDLNVDPDFARNRFMAPKPVRPVKEMKAEGYIENWICYKSTTFSAKELTVLPGKTVTIKDNACYGFITMQGHGTVGEWAIETPMLIHYGDLTSDEFFVSEHAAKGGVTIANPSKNDPIVLLKHFGPDNPDLVIE
ncbi:MAG: hypothetical protein ISS79_10835 [Phycisphaerae bacterium]|nr:hypothetical protein [Phycisphaerae bacterium]